MKFVGKFKHEPFYGAKDISRSKSAELPYSCKDPCAHAEWKKCTRFFILNVRGFLLCKNNIILV
jgi:hypothetical protein